MKSKYRAMIMGITLAVHSITAVSAAEPTDDITITNDDNAEKKSMDENQIRGEVISVDDRKVTVKTEDGEEIEIVVTDSTEITKISMGGSGPNDLPGEVPKTDGENTDGQIPPEIPDSGNTDGQTPPEIPDGGNTDGQTPPEIPDSGNTDDQTPPEIPDSKSIGKENHSEQLSLQDIQENDMVMVTLDTDNTALTITIISMEMDNNMGGPGGQDSGVESYAAVNEYTENTTVSDTSIESVGTDENAVLVSNGAEVTLDNDSISRVSSESTGGDNSSFYGVGAAVLVTDGRADVMGSTIETDSKGGAGLFAYGDGIAYISDSTIITQQDTSGGIHAAGGGTLYAWNLNVETNGESSAAIRSDRGGGTIVVDGGTYISNGVGSPAVYCTADIAVNNAELTANGSESICIEGLNSLRLYNSNLTGNMSDDDQNDTTWTVILYQSMSGDSEIGNSTFEMDGGSITSQNGGLFYTTNTECTISLKEVDITYNDDSEFFLQCTGNNNKRGWGQEGNNGSDCLFTADGQEMKGNVIWDSISDLDFYMTNGSSLEGAFINDETYAGNGGDKNCNVYIDENSVWTVTGDSEISTLSNAGTISDASGKTVSIVGTDGTVYVEGDSQYTITVNSYQDTADTSGAAAIDDWANYEAEKPEAL